MVRRHIGAKKEWKVSVPEELALNIELLFMMPGSRKPNYGARSALIVSLLEKFWEDRNRTQREAKEDKGKIWP